MFTLFESKDTVWEKRPFLNPALGEVHDLDLSGLGIIIKWPNKYLTPAILMSVTVSHGSQLFPYLSGVVQRMGGAVAHMNSFFFLSCLIVCI